MTGRGVFSVLQRLLALVILAASGTYLLVYLYRWEWNRALISGVVFVAAEIALSTSVLAHRLSADGRPADSFDLALRRLRESSVDRHHPFAWLTDRDRFGVFIPVLLGAGVVLSALAYVVERLAEATARVTIDRNLARRLAVLAPARPPTAHVDALRWERAPRRVGPIAGLIAVVVIGGLTVQVLAEATQSRPDASVRPGATTILLDVDQRSPGRVMDTAEALWVACRPVLLSRARPVADFEAVGADEVLLTLRPGIRDLATRRLTGCLADATLNKVRADVVAVHDLPAGPRPAG